MDLKSVPKIELHLHLDCSRSFEVARQMNPSVTREVYNRDFIAPERCLNLADLIKRAQKGIDLMQTEEELRLVTADLFK